MHSKLEKVTDDVPTHTHVEPASGFPCADGAVVAVADQIPSRGFGL